MLAPGDPDELADLGILVLDLFHLCDVDFGRAILKKMEVNKQRDWFTDEYGITRRVK